LETLSFFDGELDDLQRHAVARRSARLTSFFASLPGTGKSRVLTEVTCKRYRGWRVLFLSGKRLRST